VSWDTHCKPSRFNSFILIFPLKPFMIQESTLCLALPTCLTSATGQHNRPRASITSATGQNNFGHGPLLTVSHCAMASIPFVVPAFNPAARGVALDWNEKILFGHGGKNLQKALRHEGLDANGRPDIAAVVGFLQARVDVNGKSIDTLLGPPQRELDGWYRMEYLGNRHLFGESGICNSWETAWHGCERLNHYIICIN
jgi:hypothetical protein